MKLLALLKGGLGGIWGYLAAGLAALAGVVLVLAKAKKAGRDEVVAETGKKELKNVQTANEVERDVAVTKPDARRERLRNDWQRD